MLSSIRSKIKSIEKYQLWYYYVFLDKLPLIQLMKYPNQN